MRGFAWVAHASRVLVAVFHCDELSANAATLPWCGPFTKFVAARRVDQHAGRMRYPEKGIAR